MIPAPSCDSTRQWSEALSIIYNGSYIVGSLVLLIYYLVFAQCDPLTSAIYAVVALFAGAFVLSFVSATNGERDADSVGATAKEALHGLQYGARQTASIMIILAPIAIIIEMITLTALNKTISMFMVPTGRRCRSCSYWPP